jgi:hypothetical protein
LLGRPPGGPADRRLSLHADVTRTRTGVFRVRVALATAGAVGHRIFEDVLCVRVATATALVASLTLDPEGGEARASAPPLAPAAPGPEARPRPPEAQSGSVARRSFSLGAESGLDVGVFPEPALRLAAVLGLSWRSLRYEIVTGYDPEQFVPAPTRPGQGARLQLATLKLRGCVAPFDHIVEIDSCVGAEGGWFIATGEGISAPIKKAYPWAAALVGLRLLWHASGWLALGADAEGGVALLRPVFEITGSRPGFVHQPSLFLGQGIVGAEIRFQ